MKILLKIVSWIAVIALVILAVLFLTVKISGQFDSIGDLVTYLLDQIGLAMALSGVAF